MYVINSNILNEIDDGKNPSKAIYISFKNPFNL